jgi:hypothetical protein
MKKTKTETAVAQAPVAAPKAQPAELKKFNLAGIAAKPATGKPVKTYPVMPDHDGQVAELVTSIIDRAAQVEALEGALELDKSELIVLAKQFYFSHYSGQMAVASSVEARSGEKVVRVGFSNSYRGTTDDAAILRVSGERGARFFKQSFELKIKGDLIPEASVEPLIGELQELFARHNAGAALSAKAVFKPNKEFHTARHTLFTPDENFAIDKVVPISASVKTKLGRGGSDDE